MAHRDKNQGFGFVYLDISKILAQRAELEKNSGAPISTGDAKTINFNRDPQVATPVASDPSPERSVAAQQIRENLDRLQSLHHKLHAMLDELNHLTDKKKRG